MEITAKVKGSVAGFLGHLRSLLENDSPQKAHDDVNGNGPHQPSQTMKDEKEPDDYYSDEEETEDALDRRLEEIIMYDDKTRFLAFMKKHEYIIDCYWMWNMFLEKAKNCVLAVLNQEYGDVRYPAGLVANSHTCLVQATKNLCDPEVVATLLAKTDDHNLIVNVPHRGKLPIQFALANISDCKGFAPSSMKINKQSLNRLIVLLCMPELRPIIKTVQLLAADTTMVNELAFAYAKKGQLEMLAALLLASKEKLMAPFEGKLSGMSIKDCIIHMLDFSSLWDGDQRRSRNNMKLTKASQLLSIFEKTGDLLEICSGLVSVDAVMLEVGKELKRIGQTIESKDLDLSDVHSVDMSTLGSICSELGVPVPPCKKRLKSSREDKKIWIPLPQIPGRPPNMVTLSPEVSRKLTGFIPISRSYPIATTGGSNMGKRKLYHSNATLLPYKDPAFLMANLRSAARYL